MEIAAANPVQQQQPQLSNTTFADLFAPLKPVGADQGQKPPETGSNSATGVSQPDTPGSAASSQGTVTAEEALAGTKHTTLSGFSASGTPGQAAPGMVNGANPSASVNLGGIVQGEWAVNIMDAVLPALMVAAFYYFGVKIRKSELQLTEKEKQTIAPVMQKCLDSVLLNFNNPWSALAWTLGGIYGGKLMEKGLVNWIDKLNETRQDEVLRDRAAAAEREANPAKYDYTNQSAHDIQSGNVVIEGQQLYTEEDIRRRMKDGKCSRDKAIKWLNKKYGV
jgi:hypothetical protein